MLQLPLQMVRIHYRLDERLRRFLRQVVADPAAHQAIGVLAGEALGIGVGRRVSLAKLCLKGSF